MFLKNFFKRSHDDDALIVYGAIVAQARQPAFYKDCGVPDTLDGRYDLLTLHCFLYLHRLKQEKGVPEAFGQAVFDVMFQDMDQSLREMGVGDLSVGKKIKKMASVFYGRAEAYDKAIDSDDGEALHEALKRNIFPETTPPDGAVEALAIYVRKSVAVLASLDANELTGGTVKYAEIEEIVPDGSSAPEI